MRKQYKFIKHSKTDRYKSLKLADIESATTKLQFQSSYAVYHKPSRSGRDGKPIPYKIMRYIQSHDHHFKWWFEISPIRALLQARPKGRISQANYRLPLKEVIYAYLLAWFLLLVRQYTF